MTRREALTFQAGEELRRANEWVEVVKATPGRKRQALANARREAHAAQMRAIRLLDNLRANHRLPEQLEDAVRSLIKR